MSETVNHMNSPARRPVILTLPDGSRREFPKPVTGAELAAAIGPGLAKAAVAVKIDGRPRDLASLIDHDAAVAIVTREIMCGRTIEVYEELLFPQVNSTAREYEPMSVVA